MMQQDRHLYFMEQAMVQARLSREQGGIPIGSVLVIDDQIVGQGHNERIQSGNPILHGEMSALQNAGRILAQDYQRATIYTTLSPCSMCTGAILLYKIPCVVMAENENFQGREDLLQEANVSIINLNLTEAKKMMENFIREHPELWYEDIGI